MTETESLEVAAIHSIARKENDSITSLNILNRPYRSPHHTTSSIALVGGSSPPRPGEISYAHHGVLFLDELPEFNRNTLEVLREPLEQGKITIARAAHVVEFPAQFQFVAAMNLCPCGYYGDPVKACHCPPGQVQRYLRRLSGPLMERIDMHVSVHALKTEQFKNEHTKKTDSATIRKQVEKAYLYQLEHVGRPYGHLNEKETKQFCVLAEKEKQCLIDNIEKLGLSARSYHRLLRLAYTIASLRSSQQVKREDLLEALSYGMNAHHCYNQSHSYRSP